jgi:hypothetical protein
MRFSWTCTSRRDPKETWGWSGPWKWEEFRNPSIPFLPAKKLSFLGVYSVCNSFFRQSHCFGWGQSDLYIGVTFNNGSIPGGLTRPLGGSTEQVITWDWNRRSSNSTNQGQHQFNFDMSGIALESQWCCETLSTRDLNTIKRHTLYDESHSVFHSLGQSGCIDCIVYSFFDVS